MPVWVIVSAPLLVSKVIDASVPRAAAPSSMAKKLFSPKALLPSLFPSLTSLAAPVAALRNVKESVI